MGRRSFLKWATRGLGALFGAIIGFPAVLYLIDPRNRQASSGSFQRVARLNDLKKGVPYQSVVRDVRRDAWTLHPNDVIGRVWLVRRADGLVDAYTTICPHLGCSINFEENALRFVCPCHNGTFHRSGKRVSEQELGRPNPVPRNMDLLDSRLVEDPSSGEVFVEVKYENFVQGEDEKVRKT